MKNGHEIHIVLLTVPVHYWTNYGELYFQEASYSPTEIDNKILEDTLHGSLITYPGIFATSAVRNGRNY
jgi:hypothetical protein